MSKNDQELVKNRAAFYHYEILEKLEAGIALLGTEVKSLKEGGGNLSEAYVIISDHEALLKGASITPYKFGNIHNHEEKRTRKLLLHKREIEHLRKSSDIKGNTIVPLSIYIKKGKIKLCIAIAKGKQLHDKRAAIKEREIKKTISQAMKESS